MSKHPENCSWIYQARRVGTQANAGGGAQVIDISLAVGQVARLISISARNSGNAALAIVVLDEDNAVNPYANQLASVSAAAGNSLYLPSIGQAATAAGTITHSLNLILASGQKLSVFQTGAGVQNDTLTVEIVLELFNDPTVPTWDKSRSTNPADVTLAASTISAANTLVAGRMWT